MVSSCVQYNNTDGKETFTITDKQMLGTVLTIRVSEALLKEVFRYKQDKLSNLERAERTMDDTFADLYKVRPMMEMAVHTILVKQDKINDIISNES